MVTDVTGILLAGGKSRRMGKDKRFLRLGEATLFDRALGVLRAVFDEVIVVIAQDSEPLQADVPVIRDLVPDGGSLGGIYTGLSKASSSYVFVVACDMPFLDPHAVQALAEAKDECDIVMVEQGAMVQPMHALYGRRCLPAMEKMLKAKDLKIQNLLLNASLRVRIIKGKELEKIDPDGRSFLNINTPADLDAARALHARPRIPKQCENE